MQSDSFFHIFVVKYLLQMASNTKIKSEFYLALNAVATERGISVDEVLDSMKAAILAAYVKDFAVEDVESLSVELDSQSGELRLFQNGKDITPPGFGRIAAQTARQVIVQKIREAEKKHVVNHFQDLVGSLVKGRIIRSEGRFWTVDLGKANAVMPPEDQIDHDIVGLNDSGMFYLKEIREDLHGNPQLIVSRAHPNLVSELFKREVPEVANNAVKIVSIVRAGGIRTKMAVSSDQPGVDPVGACVGQKGIRVKSVNDSLGNEEKLDIIQYSTDPVNYIREAISPASVENIQIDKTAKRAKVFVKPEQASLAIGRGGTNVRLASELTGFELDIVEVVDSKSSSDKKVEEKDTDTTPVEEKVTESLENLTSPTESVKSEDSTPENLTDTTPNEVENQG